MSESEKFKTKKSLGQHFLTSPVVPQWMCDAADVVTGDIVVEVGPGTGILTRELLARGAQVIALEADKRAIEVLQETFLTEITDQQLTVHHCDVRHFDLARLDLPSDSFKIVSNIPYYLSGMLFRICLAGEVKPSTLIFLVQKEVAKRITTDLSKGEKESLLSLSVKLFGTPSYVRTVSRGHFAPPPKIDSGILLVRNISHIHVEAIDQSLFFDVLHLGFGQKRKQLLKNLRTQFDTDTLTNSFSTCSLPLSTRAEDVALEKWLCLVEKLQHTTTHKMSA